LLKRITEWCKKFFIEIIEIRFEFSECTQTHCHFFYKTDLDLLFARHGDEFWKKFDSPPSSNGKPQYAFLHEPVYNYKGWERYINKSINDSIHSDGTADCEAE